MTVAEMLGRISSAELTEWMVYYSITASEISGKAPAQPKAQSAEQQKFLLSGLLGTEK